MESFKKMILIRKTILIIPCFNERSSILKKVLLEFEDFYIILIHDGCNGKCKKNAPSKGFILNHVVNFGQGAALESGFQLASNLNFEYIATVDADGQHKLFDLLNMLNYLEDNKSIDVLLGSRFLKNRFNSYKSNISFFRKMLLKCGIIFNLLFTGVMLTDAHCGLRVVKYGCLGFLKFNELRSGHATEILKIANRCKWNMKEFGINVEYSKYSLEKGQKNFDAFKILFRLLINKL